MPAGFKLNLGYEHPDLGDEPRADPLKAMEVATAKWAGELLERHYAGHPWKVEVKGGMILISIPPLMGALHHYAVKISDTLTDPGGQRTVLRGAGEILERYQIPRQRFDLDHWRQAMSHVPFTGRGNLAPLQS